MITITIDGNQITNLFNGSNIISETKWLDTVTGMFSNEKDYESVHLLAILTELIDRRS